MAGIKAFDKWDAEKLEGNPYAASGSVKVFMDEPKIPLILDTREERMAFIAVQLAASNRFSLPKSNRTEEEKKRAVYYAIYTPASEWDIVEGAYVPAAGTSAEELVRLLVPAPPVKSTDPAYSEAANEDLSIIRRIISESQDKAPYTSGPLTQRQMLEQAAYINKMSVEEYIDSVIPPKRRQWAYSKFGVDVPATA